MHSHRFLTPITPNPHRVLALGGRAGRCGSQYASCAPRHRRVGETL